MTPEQAIIAALDACECPTWAVDRGKARAALDTLVRERDGSMLLKDLAETRLRQVEADLAAARAQVDAFTKRIEQACDDLDEVAGDIRADTRVVRAALAVRPEPQDANKTRGTNDRGAPLAERTAHSSEIGTDALRSPVAPEPQEPTG